jgi:DNA-binding GntR family transcriptional regulator
MKIMSSDFAPPPLSRGLLSDQAYEVIRQSIIDGTFAPGEQLVESQLARKLNISQAPMREALKKLSHEGLVTNVPRRGSFVTEVSEDEAAQAREVRCALEELAARLTAGRLSAGHAAQLREIVKQMRLAAKDRDIATFRVHDTAFHRTVMEASGNAYLPRLWLQIEPTLQSLQVISGPRFAGDWTAMAQAHADLVSVLETDSADVAATRFREHLHGKALAAVTGRATPARPKAATGAAGRGTAGRRASR